MIDRIIWGSARKDDVGFQVDCLVYALFSGQSRVKSADGMNHWIPFTEEEVEAKSCFKSHFMCDFLGGRTSPCADVTRGAMGGVAPCQGELALGGPRFTATVNVDAINCVPPVGAADGDARPPNLVNPVNPVEKLSAPPCRCVKENLSPAVRAVLDAGRELWRYYHSQPDATLGRPASRNGDMFGYNGRGEVVFSRRGAENAEEDSYAYDDIGNLMLSAFSAATNTYTANNLNQYTSILRASAPPREISHDDDGNMTDDGVFSYTYDSASRLLSVTSNDILLVTSQ